MRSGAFLKGLTAVISCSECAPKSALMLELMSRSRATATSAAAAIADANADDVAAAAEGMDMT